MVKRAERAAGQSWLLDVGASGIMLRIVAAADKTKQKGLLIIMTELCTGHQHGDHDQGDPQRGVPPSGDHDPDSALTPQARAARQAELVAGLLAILPETFVLHAAEDLRPYECDGLSAYRQLPLLVVLPRPRSRRSSGSCACAIGCGVPVVARGAGTGLSGGALPLGDGVLLSPGALQVASCTSTRWPAPPGCSRGCATWPSPRRRAPHGLYYAPDPSVPDRLHHRRQRGGELRRRALPEIRADGPQRPGD